MLVKKIWFEFGVKKFEMVEAEKRARPERILNKKFYWRRGKKIPRPGRLFE